MSSGGQPHSSSHGSISDGGSAELWKTPVKVGDSPRECYIKYRDTLPAPQIAHSHFVPKATVEFLMRYKKDSAIAVKFFSRNNTPDRITDMEGARHTFVTPMVKATMHGDYKWSPGHGIKKFGGLDGYQLGRTVLVSALVQQDFENDRVMMRIAGLGKDGRFGRSTLPTPIPTKDKQNTDLRRDYDDKIRDCLVYHLTRDHHLPAIDLDIKETALSIPKILDHLAMLIERVDATDIPRRVQNVFFHDKSYFISLEIMFSTAVEQIRNEFVLLEKLNKQKGYVYTFNPPAIFVHWFSQSGTELLSRIHVAALKYVAGALMRFRHCRVFAWADFNSPNILSLVKKALESQPQIRVMRKDDLFSGKTGAGLYDPPMDARAAMLVIHNNSDAFGQNIETEFSGGSLDGVIGEYSSTAASLMRDRKDLCDNLVEIRRI